MDNLIKALKNDITYNDPDSIYPDLCEELEKISPKDLTASIAPKDLTASTTPTASTGICVSEAPSSMIFQAQLAEFISISPEEDLRVKKNITAQPSREPLPSSSAFQAQKNPREALDLEAIAHLFDNNKFEVIEESYEDFMRNLPRKK